MYETFLEGRIGTLQAKYWLKTLGTTAHLFQLLPWLVQGWRQERAHAQAQARDWRWSGGHSTGFLGLVCAASGYLVALVFGPIPSCTSSKAT
jgi:hypothetical protein